MAVSKSTIPSHQFLSYEPPRYVGERGEWEWVYHPYNTKFSTPIFRHNPTGMLVYPFVLKSSNKPVTAENLTTVPRCYNAEGESINPPAPVVKMASEFRDGWLTRYGEQTPDRPKTPQKKRKAKKQESSDDSDEEPEKQKAPAKKKTTKEKRARRETYCYPITLERLKQQILEIDDDIKDRMKRKPEFRRGIPFIYKESDTAKVYFYDIGTNEKRYYRARVVGASLATKGKPRLVPEIKIGNNKPFQQPTRALKALLAIAFGVNDPKKLSADYADVKGYLKLVQEDNTKVSLEDWFPKKLRFPKIVSEEDYQKYLLQQEIEERKKSANVRSASSTGGESESEQESDGEPLKGDYETEFENGDKRVVKHSSNVKSMDMAPDDEEEFEVEKVKTYTLKSSELSQMKLAYEKFKKSIQTKGLEEMTSSVYNAIVEHTLNIRKGGNVEFTNIPPEPAQPRNVGVVVSERLSSLWLELPWLFLDQNDQIVRLIGWLNSVLDPSLEHKLSQMELKSGK